MNQDDNSKKPESSNNTESVMSSFMTDLATQHNQQAPPPVITSTGDSSASIVKTSDGEPEIDLLNSVFADEPACEAEPLANNKKSTSELNTQASSKKDSPDLTARTALQQEFAKAMMFSTSKVPLIVYGTLGFALFVCGQFPTAFANLLFSPEELQELPGFILDNIPTVFGGFFFLLAFGAIYLGMKESFTGKLNVYEDYLAFKSKLFKRPDKIHYADLRSIVIHRSPYSAFGDIAHLEVMGKSKEFMFKNVSKPFELKETLLERKNNFLNNH